MFFIECPFCHQQIFRLWYPSHKARHMALMADGQMTDHITVAEHERYMGSLDGVPQVYYHPLCDGSTGMPEEIIRSYLANPFLYNDTTFCTGCNDYVPEAECFWTETGQNLGEYKLQLQQAYLQRYGQPPPRPHV
jgi:hypothetical protein